MTISYDDKEKILCGIETVVEDWFKEYKIDQKNQVNLIMWIEGVLLENMDDDNVVDNKGD